MKAADILKLCEYLVMFERNDSYEIEIVPTSEGKLMVLDYHNQLSSAVMSELGFEWYCRGGFVEVKE